MKHRYFAEANGTQYLVIVEQTAEGTRLGIAPLGEGEPEALEPIDFAFVQAPGTYSLIADGQSVLAHLETDAEDANLWHAALRRHRAEVRVQTEREYKLSKIAAPRQQAGGELTIKAPMPGLVKQVSVGEGEQVTKGQRLIVLEAMKMENDIQAPRDGVVKSIKVQGGDAVENGRPLVVLE